MFDGFFAFRPLGDRYRYERQTPLPEVTWTSEPVFPPLDMAEIEAGDELAQTPPTEREIQMLETIEQQNETLTAMQQEIIRLSAIEVAANGLYEVIGAAAAKDGLPLFKVRRREDPEMATQLGHAFVDLTHALGVRHPPALLGDERILH